MLRRLAVASTLAFLVACGDDPVNPFNRLTAARPPSPDASLLFLSGSWAEAGGQPREVLALKDDGTQLEQLTACARLDPPCDFLQVAPSPDRNRLVAIRTTPDAQEGASALYYMDLSRAVETIIFPNRQVLSADYSPDSTFVVFSAVFPQTSQEDLYYSRPNGSEEDNLTQTLTVRERNARIDPFGRTAVFERIDETGVARITLFPATVLTDGPTTGEPLPGTPYVVGADADPVFSPDGVSVAFRRLTGTGNGGLGTWDILTLALTTAAQPVVVVSGPLYRGAPDWGPKGIVFVETDAATSRSELVVVPPDGSGRRVLRGEDAGYRMRSPRWLAGS